MTFVCCETVAAITMHIRIVGDTPISYSGFAVRPKTLCEKAVGWDTLTPIVAARCLECMIVAIVDADFCDAHPVAVTKFKATIDRIAELRPEQPS